MVKHIVFWKLKENAEGADKRENAVLIKQKLESLIGVIPEIVSLEVGINFSGGEFDVALYSAFNTKEDLASYDANPEHAKVKRFIGAVSEKREAVDYEV